RGNIGPADELAAFQHSLDASVGIVNVGIRIALGCQVAAEVFQVLQEWPPALLLMGIAQAGLLAFRIGHKLGQHGLRRLLSGTERGTLYAAVRIPDSSEPFRRSGFDPAVAGFEDVPFFAFALNLDPFHHGFAVLVQENRFALVSALVPVRAEVANADG